HAGQPEPFLVEIIGSRGRGLEGDRPVHFGADLLHLHLPVVVLLRQEAGVGGAATQYPPFLDRSDLVQVGGVQEQLHRLLASTSIERRTGCRRLERFRRDSIAFSTTWSISFDSA